MYPNQPSGPAKWGSDFDQANRLREENLIKAPSILNSALHSSSENLNCPISLAAQVIFVFFDNSDFRKGKGDDNVGEEPSMVTVSG